MTDQEYWAALLLIDPDQTEEDYLRNGFHIPNFNAWPFQEFTLPAEDIVSTQPPEEDIADADYIPQGFHITGVEAWPFPNPILPAENMAATLPPAEDVASSSPVEDERIQTPRPLSRAEYRDLAIRQDIELVIRFNLTVHDALSSILGHLSRQSGGKPFTVYRDIIDQEKVYDRSTFAIKQDGLALFRIATGNPSNPLGIVVFHQPHRVILFQTGPIKLPEHIDEWGFLGRWIREHAWRQLNGGKVHVVGISHEAEKGLNALSIVVGFVGGRLLLRGDKARGDPFVDDGVLGVEGGAPNAWLFRGRTSTMTRTMKLSNGQVTIGPYEPTR